MRLDVSVNHIRPLWSRKYPGCQAAFCQCSHWLLPTFHYNKCSFYARQGVFYREDGQETHPGSIWACQPWTDNIPSQLLIVSRFLKACDRLNCNSRQPHQPQPPSCNFSGSTRLKTKPLRSVWQVCWMYLYSKPAVGNPTLAGLRCTLKQHKRGRR